MKNESETKRYRAELTDSEITVLLCYYSEALRETEKCKSPIVQAQREINKARHDEVARYRDGRCWNRGKGRKAKPDDPGPALPLENNPVIETLGPKAA